MTIALTSKNGNRCKQEDLLLRKEEPPSSGKPFRVGLTRMLLLMLIMFLSIFTIGEFDQKSIVEWSSSYTGPSAAGASIVSYNATSMDVEQMTQVTLHDDDDNDDDSLTLLSITPSTYTHPCAVKTQGLLESTAYGPLDLRASMPEESSSCSWKPGEAVRIPVYNIDPTGSSGDDREWHYDLWARLVGETTHTYTTFSQITIYTGAQGEKIAAARWGDNNTKSVLFAEIDFHIWEPDTYQLQIEIRYIYGSSKETADYTGNWSKFTKMVYTPPLLEQVHRSGLFRYNPSVADVFPRFFSNYTPVHYMGNLEDTRSFSRLHSQEEKANNRTAPTDHDFWIQNNCFGIQGSPYIMRVDTQRQQRQQKQQHNATKPANEDANEDPTEPKQEEPKQRQCDISDTHKPGHWRKIPVNCTIDDTQQQQGNTSSKYHQGCGYFWDATYIGMGYVYETPGCTWEFMNATQLQPCLEAIDQTMYFVGDSLIRNIMTGVRRYIFHYAKQSIPIRLRGDWKGQGEPRGPSIDLHDGHSFPMDQGGVFIDDFMLVHRIGFGADGTLSGLESSPGNLARQLWLHKQWFQNHTGTARADGGNKTARFIFYLPHYVNDRQQPQLFEPQMSYYSAVLGTFLQSELGYEIFNSNQITRGLPEGSQDGLHILREFMHNMALVLINSICSTPTSE